MKKFISMLLSTMLIVTCFATTGCGSRRSGEVVDELKSQLYVGFFEGGFGRDWYDAAVSDFEEKYKDYEFEPGSGKKGVQIVTEAKKDQFKPENLKPSLENNLYNNYMYIVSMGDYETFYNAGLLKEMTSVLEQKVYDDVGEIVYGTDKTATKSMLDFMNKDYAGIVNKGSVSNPRYYGIPESYYVPSLFYDADYFNDYGLYLDENNEFGATQADIDAGNCGKGPDGKLGTLDDGMPATYSEFLALLAEIKEKQGIPMTWSGNTTYQARYAYEQFWANWEGAEEYRLNFTWDGTSRYATDSGSNVVTKNSIAEISSKQEGRKAGIQLFYDIIKNEYYPGNLKSRSYTDAQSDFITSKMSTNGRIAMFMEGGYWEAEAKSVFNSMSGGDPNNENAYGKRDFRLLPVPNFEGQKNTNSKEVVLTKGGDSLIFFTEKNKSGNNDIQFDMASKFLQYISSRSQVVNFTANTGACFKPFTYGLDGTSLTDAEIGKFTKYAQSAYKYMCEAMKDGDNAVVHSAIRHPDRDKLVDSNFPKFSFFAGDVYSPASYFMNRGDDTVETCYQALQVQVRNSLK